MLRKAQHDRVTLLGVRREANVDRRRRSRLVLDLGFRQRRFVVDAPERRAQTFIDLLTLGQIGKGVYDRCFKRRVDRAVWMVEEAEGAHPPAVLSLTLEPVEGAFFALRAQFERIDGVKILDSQILERFVLDGESVHIPAGNELRILPVEQCDLHEHVLEHHVQEMAHVQLAVRVRRSVVQNPRAARRVALQAPFVRTVVVPPLDALRLSLGKVRLHWKGGPRQIQRAPVIHHSSSKSSPRTSKFRSAAAWTTGRRAANAAESCSRSETSRSTSSSIAPSLGGGLPGIQSGCKG